MAIMMKAALEKEYVQVPNSTAKAVEEKNNVSPISLEALGLIVNLWSYDVTKWEVRKTELYKRFGKNKKTSVMNAWDDLVKNDYIIEFKYRVGRKWEYVYIYRIEPFSKEEKEKKIAECVELTGVRSTSDFEKLKMNSSKCASQNQQISNIKEKQDTTKKDNIKDIGNKEIESPLENLKSDKDFLTDIANDFYAEFALNRWSKKQWFILVSKMVDEILERGIELTNARAYIYKSLGNAAYKHDYKNNKIDFEERNESMSRPVPFYNWVEEDR